MNNPSHTPVRIALIGSRELHSTHPNTGEYRYPEDILLLHKICYRLARLGIIMRSGLCAKGLDAIAQIEYSRALDQGLARPEQFEVFVYQKKRSALPHPELAVLRNPELVEELERRAASVHGGWHNCDEAARGQHSRNVHQVFGYQLDTPVQAVITWCRLNHAGQPLGGTATAIKLARQADIPVLNLYQTDHDSFLASIRSLLQQHQIQTR